MKNPLANPKHKIVYEIICATVFEGINTKNICKKINKNSDKVRYSIRTLYQTGYIIRVPALMTDMRKSKYIASRYVGNNK